MSNVIITPNMSLPVPVPGSEPGPQYATDQNNAFTIVDAHNHAPGSGVVIPSAGIGINADLPFNGFNATLLKSTRFTAQLSPLTAVSPNIGCVYVSGVDLYYNDLSGNQIRITSSGSVAGSSGTITGLPSGTASAAYDSVSGTFIFQQATSTAANIDGATLIVRYPGSYPTPSGNYIALQAPSSLATGYALTLPALPSANNTFLTIGTAGTIAASFTVDNSTLEFSGSNLIVKALGITAAQIANTTITAAKIVSGTITGTQITTNVNLAGTGVKAGGKNVIVNNTNNIADIGLSIIRGRINSNGAIAAGEGFTVPSSGSGIYTVAFSEAYLDVPAVSFSVLASGYVVFIQSISSSGFVCTVSTPAGAVTPQDFTFMAIGGRAT